jgi:tetratricopeptide (TPR) repeat protein
VVNPPPAAPTRLVLRSALAALSLLAMLAPAGRARAAQELGSDRRAAEARQACASGNVEEAIELLAQIIAETGDANAVYNQARCYQANGRSVQALVRFREYLRIAGRLDPNERAQVRRYIAELEQGLGTPPRDPDYEASDSLRRSLRLFGVGVALLAVAPLAFATHFRGVGKGLEREIAARPDPVSGPEFDRLWGRARRYYTLQWTGYAVGAVMLIAAGGLFTLGSRSSSGSSSSGVTLNAQLAPGAAGALLSGRF